MSRTGSTIGAVALAASIGTLLAALGGAAIVLALLGVLPIALARPELVVIVAAFGFGAAIAAAIAAALAVRTREGRRLGIVALSFLGVSLVLASVLAAITWLAFVLFGSGG